MIVVRLSGGIGNQMFQYAVARVLSLKNNTSLVFNIEAYLDRTPRPFNRFFVVRTYDLEAFTIAGRVAEKREIPFLFRMYWKGRIMLLIDALRRRVLRHRGKEISHKEFDPNILTLGQDAYLDGYFQFPQYFSGYEDVIRKDFTLKREVSQNIKDLLVEIQNSESVCIFVRRTDFIGNKQLEVVNAEYYHRGVRYLEERVPIAKIYVFSDDTQWCRDNLVFSHPTMFVDDSYAGEKFTGKMLLMSSCKYSVIPNSTFCWWTAWLCNRTEKLVICPKEWLPGFSSQDVVPGEWVRI